MKYKYAKEVQERLGNRFPNKDITINDDRIIVGNFSFGYDSLSNLKERSLDTVIDVIEGEMKSIMSEVE